MGSGCELENPPRCNAGRGPAQPGPAPHMLPTHPQRKAVYADEGKKFKELLAKGAVESDEDEDA